MRGRARSRLMRTLAVAAVAGGAWFVVLPAQAANAQRPTVVRKSASDMTPAEINRFRRAFSYAVRKGYFDVFSAEHYDQMRNRQHGADVLATAPPSAKLGETPAWGQRLLPWHRAFILEAEDMLRDALRERNRREGRDPREANRLFIPHWDAAGDGRLALWVRAFKPRGGRGVVPPDIPRGHAAYGKPVGSSYRVRFGRWPGGNILFDRTPPADQISRIVGQADFNGFLQALDVVPEVVQTALPAAKLGLQTLVRMIPGDPNLQTVIAATSPTYPKDPASQLAAFNALMAVGSLATTSAAADRPDRGLIAAVEALFAAFRFPPHFALHFYAGGLHPNNPDVRGTVTYFNELAVDPAFWMLHAELDRYWFTWQQSHDSGPALQGADAQFQPLTRREARRYGGGRRYELAELTRIRDLPYRYDAAAGSAIRPATLGAPVPATASRAAAAPAISTAGAPVCRLVSS